MQFLISRGIFNNSFPQELHDIFNVLYWFAGLHGLVENLKSLGEKYR